MERSEVWKSYKLVISERAACDTASPIEFYDLTPRPDDPVNPLGLDNADDDLLKSSLNPEQAANLRALRRALGQLLDSEVACPGDGNLDKRVDRKDFVGVQTNKGQSSVFDFTADGVTDDADLQIVKDNFGLVCSQ